MIQRIQSVYLFFAFCLMAIILFIPFSASSTVSVCSGIVAILAIITIFLYKKRKLQIKICYLLLFFLVLIYALFFIFDGKDLQVSELFQVNRFTVIFPFIAFILIYLAMRGIRKDEKLVRSLDRLR